MKCALIGDVRASRDQPDQAGLFARIDTILGWVNNRLEPLQPLAITVGDEFQGLFATRGDALLASMLVLVRAVPDIEMRLGLGEGSVEVHGDDPRAAPQSGTAWWHARDAIDQLARMESKRGTPRTIHTWFESDDDAWTGTVNAYLVGRDHLISRFDEMDSSILLGLLDGETQSAIAARLETAQSNVSRRATTGGVYNVLQGAALLLGGQSENSPLKSWSRWIGGSS